MNAGGENNFSVVSDLPTNLYVDDKSAHLNSLKSLLDGTFNILTASSGKEGLGIFETQPAQVIMADQKLPDMRGAEFLKGVKDKGIYRIYILITRYNDNKVINEVDNDVVIHWYMNKPFDRKKLIYILPVSIESLNQKNS